MPFDYNKSSPFGRAHGDILSRVNEKELQVEDQERIVAELKSRGNAAFKSKRPEEAHLLYSAAIHVDDTNWAIFGNRSAVNEMMGKGTEALEDAKAASSIKPDWAKGFFRQGKAYACLKRYRESTQAFEQALSLEPDSKMLKKSVVECRGVCSWKSGLEPVGRRDALHRILAGPESRPNNQRRHGLITGLNNAQKHACKRRDPSVDNLSARG